MLLESALASPPIIWAWRHPRAEGAVGRCIGVTDLAVDARRAKRLARRIQQVARRHALPQVVHTSPLQRGAAVGRWLRRWGWVHVIDPALIEMGFGAWEGRLWADIPRHEIDAWCAAFTSLAPGGAETLAAVLERAAQWPPPAPMRSVTVVVGHAGWMLARRWRHEHGDRLPSAAEWPMPPAHGVLWMLAGAESAVGGQQPPEQRRVQDRPLPRERVSAGRTST